MHILFVCWGNICRSPAAEATFRKLLTENGLDEKITCDSAGTIGQHHGTPHVSRILSAARSWNLPISGSASMANDQVFVVADLILTMDILIFQLSNWLLAMRLVRRLCLCTYVSSGTNEVPDPYYGGASGFEKVLIS